MQYRDLSREERQSFVSLMKGAWFFVVTAGRAIRNLDMVVASDLKRIAKSADDVGGFLDDYLKEL